MGTSSLWTGSVLISPKKVLANGKKVNFLVIVDRASGFVRVYRLRGTKTKHVVGCLQDFNNVYCGPHYWITSDGGPHFAAANQAIKSWCEDASIRHKLSSAFNLEGNEEAEQAVQKVKLAIAHVGDNLKSIMTTVANINFDQRTDTTGSPTELFLQRTLRVLGLATIPTHL